MEVKDLVVGERHPLANPDGGFWLQDPDNRLSSAAKEVIKKIGGKLLKLKFFDLMKISGPAKVAHDITYLEWFLNDYTYFPRYMKSVVETKDNIERLKYISAAMIGGLHVGMMTLQAMSPLNPILGETCQRVGEDGTRYFAEQVTHHPPVSAAYMEGPEDLWKFELMYEFKAGLNSHNSVKAQKSGAIVITLFDGTQYVIEEGTVNVEGIVYGQMVIRILDKITIKDITNNMTWEVVFDPDKEGTLSSMASKLKFWGSKAAKRPADHWDINIYQQEEDKDDRALLTSGKGSYLEYVEFDGERYWELGNPWGVWEKPDDNELLMSDSSRRPDLQFITNKDYESAQKAKEELENQQRDDKKNRDKKRPKK